MKKLDLCPIKIANVIVSALMFLYYFAMYVSKLIDNGNIQSDNYSIDIFSVVYVSINLFVFRWISEIKGVLMVESVSIPIVVRGISYFVWFSQIIAIVYKLVEKENIITSLDGILMASSMTISFCYLFGKKNGLLSYVKYAFDDTNKNVRKSKKKR